MAAAVLATIRKDLLDSARHPLFLVISVVIPLVFVGLFALIIQTSATSPIAVADQARSVQSQQLIGVLADIGNADGRYFRVTTTDPQRAAADYERGRVPGIIHVPEDFDERVRAGEASPVTLEMFNIDSDLTKNLELRLSHAVTVFDRLHGGRLLPQVEEQAVFGSDMPMQRYFGTALLMFAMIFLSMMNTGSLVASEWEQRTAKSIVLSPLGFGPLIAGKWAAGTCLSVAGFGVVLLVVAIGLDYPVVGLGPASWLHLVVLLAFGASLGALLGVKLQSSLLLVPATAVISVTHLLLAGFESYIRGFAHDGVLQALWWVGAWWPVSALTDSIRLDVEQHTQTCYELVPLLWMVAITGLLTLVAVRHLRNQLTFSQGM